MAAPPRVDAPPPLHWDGAVLRILDQTRLPVEERVLTLSGAAETAEAIRRLAVRGAPLIGVAAAYGLAMEVARDPSPEALERGAAVLAGARPTARNLAWAVERVVAAAVAAPPHELATAARSAAEAIHRDDRAASEALARWGADALSGVLPDGPVTVMTHCNSGALAASGRGTGLGVIAALAERRDVRVLACEARPLLQGARLTVWELQRLGIEHELLVDAAAAGLLRRGAAQAVVTGFDRVAANGDVANKVGTYGLALAARAEGVPFVAAGPSSSIDLRLPTGEMIEIEERSADEVRSAGGALLTVAGTPCRNPAFDVTPASLVWALVTEHGTASPVTAETVAAVA
ncbi:MAG TPA: S-methyl-5-thioribose-1-phosphate isomerase [Solirubrobacteraceae bacterium]|jgi:methylthioribose-1-phosphate isomerase|nr:S-methyl-5-thioribose-1-phosphate isomerase [Solirubrobacteraceae bacterium]